jgi:hypothetical protein
MLDQSFSADNFRQILDYENRKGLYLEGKYFPEVARVKEEIKQLNIAIKAKKGVVSPEAFELFVKETNIKIEELKVKKDELLNKELQKVSEKIINDKFKIAITKNDAISDKPVYTIDDKPENFFALKQIQQNFRKLYKVKQSSRYSILSQIKVLLNDKFPKYVIRTDIENFYESIPHDRLLHKLNEENLLTFSSKRIISQILNEYKKLSGSTTQGLPRGIGISAYLSELYMRDIDRLIKNIPSVTYYARYVDDIIIIFTPTTKKEPRDYIDKIDEIIETKFGLTRNEEKTVPFDLIDLSTSNSFEYLGYKITFGHNGVSFDLTTNKQSRYKSRIDSTITAYINYAKVDEKKARKLLIKRIRFLTGNTKLINNKKNVLVGVYYSNNLLTNSSVFKGIDSYLKHQVTTRIASTKIHERIDKYKFYEGFMNKRFSSFKSSDLSKILEIY